MKAREALCAELRLTLAIGRFVFVLHTLVISKQRQREKPSSSKSESHIYLEYMCLLVLSWPACAVC